MKLLQSNKITSANETYSALNMIQTQLNTLLALEPLTNTLLTIPQVFISSELSETTTNVLNEVRVILRKLLPIRCSTNKFTNSGHLDLNTRQNYNYAQ